MRWTYQGISLHKWCRQNRVSYSTVQKRLYNGLSLDDAVSKPVGYNRSTPKGNEVGPYRRTRAEWAELEELTGVSRDTIRMLYQRCKHTVSWFTSGQIAASMVYHTLRGTHQRTATRWKAIEQIVGYSRSWLMALLKRRGLANKLLTDDQVIEIATDYIKQRSEA